MGIVNQIIVVRQYSNSLTDLSLYETYLAIEISHAKRIFVKQKLSIPVFCKNLESQELADLILGESLTMSGFFTNERNAFWFIQSESVSSQSSMLKFHIIFASISRNSRIPIL